MEKIVKSVKSTEKKEVVMDTVKETVKASAEVKTPAETVAPETKTEEKKPSVVQVALEKALDLEKKGLLSTDEIKTLIEVLRAQKTATAKVENEALQKKNAKDKAEKAKSNEDYINGLKEGDKVAFILKGAKVYGTFGKKNAKTVRINGDFGTAQKFRNVGFDKVVIED